MSSGMMMNDRPGDNGGPIGASSVSIGNYKGVMLCNRPFAGASGAAAKQASGTTGAGSFKCGTVETPLGENVKISEHQKMVAKMSKKDSVLSKHKRWLNELQKTKEKLQDEYIASEEKKEAQKEKFMAREAKMRAIVRGTIGPTKHRQEELALMGETADGDEKKVEEKDDGSSTATRVPKLPLVSEPKKSSSKSKMSMPAWAMTEDAAKEVEENKEEEEEEDLMDFVDGLDFDKDIEDLELKVLMDQVRERISKLEDEKGYDEKALNNLLQAEIERAKRAEKGDDLAEDWADIVAEMGGEDEDIKEIAMTAREEEGMKEVHSLKSMKALVAQRKDKLEGGGSSIDPIPENDEATLAPPRIITHTDDDGTRISGKNQVDKLPYLNRNPAV
ncbi:hypothetical protein TrCOL_g7683 [Triparma columacea]|uniref:Uncharacterized protein n=1 Tax=Triparma columacea TaxID=722753 RepID=A0A9W7GJ30_9STRA|nr:hypothetical protein TrCOL_g7683 [Triparma columacea]